MIEAIDIPYRHRARTACKSLAAAALISFAASADLNAYAQGRDPLLPPIVPPPIYLPHPLPIRLEGQPNIIDAGTLAVAGRTVRLYDLEAPTRGLICRRNTEAWQCGQEAARALGAWLALKRVTCDLKPGAEPRTARCFLEGNSIDVGLWVLQQGWARATAAASADYVTAAAEARNARRGLWAAD